MIESAVYFIQHGLLLLFGLILSASFTGVRLTKKNFAVFLMLFILCAGLQILFYIPFGETAVRKLYPLIVHLPTILLLCLYYRKKLSSTFAAITTAYLCCQPGKWLGILAETLTDSVLANQITYCIVLIADSFVLLFLLAPYISEIYTKRHRVFLFGCIPMLYYLFEYIGVVYTELWTNYPRATTEFPPVFLCFAHLLSCIIYYNEAEQKASAERKEQIVRIVVAQQAKELDLVKRNEQEVRFIRHDLKLLLDNLSLCLDVGDTGTAKKVISSFTSRMESTTVQTYCGNAIVNYILSDFAAKCQAAEVDFIPSVELPELTADEVIFSSILSNGLDNALKSQHELPQGMRRINLMLKTSGSKLLLSVRNPIKTPPRFVDGLPMSKEKGHGYGTQSIRYLAGLLGGHCQFTIEEQDFVLRIVV